MALITPVDVFHFLPITFHLISTLRIKHTDYNYTCNDSFPFVTRLVTFVAIHFGKLLFPSRSVSHDITPVS